MNLLGMKRRLLPYGMPLGGAGGAAAPSGGGKSSPAPSPRAPGFSNSLGFMSNALRGSVAQVQQPMQGGFGGMLGGGGAPSSGGKSSGLGQGGYGAAPGFQQPTAQNSPMQQSPFPPTPLHMMGDDFGRGNSGGMPMQGGKSLGGVSPYGDAPGFGGQPFDPRFSPAQMENRSRFQGSRLEGDNIVDASGRRIGAIGMAAPMQGGFGQIRLGTPEEQAQARANVRQLTPEESTAQFIMNARRAESFAGAPQLSNQGLAQRGMQGGFDDIGALAGRQGMQGGFGGAQMQAPTREAYDTFMASAKFAPGTRPTYEQWAQNQTNRAAEQDFVNPRGTMSPEMQAYYVNRRFQQPMQQFNPYQQSPFNPYQQPMQQPGFSGLQDLFNMMMGQNMGGFNRSMPQYQSPSSMYRPNMQQVQQNLSRVRPSVQRQRQDEQAARIAELEAQLARFNSGE